MNDTSWSCHHGVLRWTGNCACTPGDGAWKAQLRHAFERLAEELDRLYEDVAASLVGDPWELRNRYIRVVLGKETLPGLLAGMTERTLTSEQVRRVHLMLEAQRERQRMFTSCGWFFDDFDRIEPKNNVAYAAQAVRLARLATGVDLEQAVVADLQPGGQPAHSHARRPGIFASPATRRRGAECAHRLRRLESLFGTILSWLPVISRPDNQIWLRLA